jgi:hypothetical protein
VVHRWHFGAGRSLCCGRRKKNRPDEASDHALGRSRGGFSTKIHLLCDGHTALLEGADRVVTNGDDEPVAWPIALAGDKGYRADWIDEYLLERGIEPVIPSKENEDRAARAVEFDKQAYRRRSIIEQLIGWLKESRRILSRFESFPTEPNLAGAKSCIIIVTEENVICFTPTVTFYSNVLRQVDQLSKGRVG